MLVAPAHDGSAHAVSLNPATTENPLGFHRLIGGSVEVGETHREAVLREAREELDVDVRDLTYLGVVESFFRIDGEQGHEIVFLYSGLLDPMPPAVGTTLTESDGSVVPVVWRDAAAGQDDVPLFPVAALPFVEQALAARRGAP